MRLQRRVRSKHSINARHKTELSYLRKIRYRQYRRIHLKYVFWQCKWKKYLKIFAIMKSTSNVLNWFKSWWVLLFKTWGWQLMPMRFWFNSVFKYEKCFFYVCGQSTEVCTYIVTHEWTKFFSKSNVQENSTTDSAPSIFS